MHKQLIYDSQILFICRSRTFNHASRNRDFKKQRQSQPQQDQFMTLYTKEDVSVELQSIENKTFGAIEETSRQALKPSSPTTTHTSSVLPTPRKLPRWPQNI
ncbi:Hypothetical_protein [Hexamita inflata]|uniref:Hypothetical_protein n=1 Tax=Hexamita inflata TaxID=28002 RepID=A0AA86TN30_9EUKA|nr:Hypothetical protein HINF_LOCUS10021 [Hexamita inflata]